MVDETAAADVTDVLTIAQPGVVPADPHAVTDVGDTLSVTHAHFETLTDLGPQGGLSPVLATEWTAGPDAREWVFRLRPGVRFQDGAPLVADDVAWSIRRMASGATGGVLGSGGAFSAYLAPLELTATDPTTIRLRSLTPLADLPDLLAAVPIARPGKHGGLVGTGPYLVDEGGADGARCALVMRAFGDYWASRASAEQVRWVAEPDAERRVAMVARGEADIATRLGPAVETPAAQERAVRSCVAVVFFLAADRPPFDRPEARLAANLAVDVPALIASIRHGRAEPLDGPVSPDHLGHAGHVRPFPHDPELARSLFDRLDLTEPLQLFAPTSIPAEGPELARAVADRLVRAGAPSEVTIVEDRAEYARRVGHRDAGHLSCFDSSPLATFRVLREKLSSRVRDRWWQGYANPRVDALIEDAARTPDRARRAAIYGECLHELRRDPAWLYLYNPTERAAVGSRVEAWRPRPDGRVDLRGIRLLTE